MTGLWVLLLLIFIAALPVLPAYLWFRSRKALVSFFWFFLSLLTGVFSLLIAAVLQFFFNTELVSAENGISGILFSIFIRIALTEETGRLLVLLVFFQFGTRLWKKSSAVSDDEVSERIISFGAATGLLNGLGFAIIETASYGMMNINIALLRAFTAAPLHGACGARVGAAALMFKEKTGYALGRFFSAVALHGMYNLMVSNPGTPRILLILIPFFTLFSSLRTIRANI
jgi:RsiW-degrading membrane proteinase PrsW (M82 family)